ncbi:MAG: hypothetical protein HY783_05250 [Chloroflexi bacterium]|nr:hypothetical protein [Chloroflexota bacterium]
MVIQSYEFGRLVVGGKLYTADVIIYPDRVQDHWWRQEGHRLSWEDLSDALAADPQVVVVGTGSTGMMEVPESVIQRLRARGIKVIVAPTGQACAEYNRLVPAGRVIAALHLTC